MIHQRLALGACTPQIAPPAPQTHPPGPPHPGQKPLQTSPHRPSQNHPSQPPPPPPPFCRRLYIGPLPCLPKLVYLPCGLA